MIGIVVVSHSAALAEAALGLALEMVHGERPRIALAAGTPDGGFGTDAARVAEAIVEVAGDDGVLVLMDLGSAVMSAELAVELLDEPAPRVELSSAPFVEGLVAAVVTAAGGGSLDAVRAEAEGASAAKREHLGDDGDDAAPAPTAAPGTDGDVVTAEVVIVNPVGLHARPAAELAGLLGRLDADVRLANASSGAGPVPGASVLGIISLGVQQGETLRITATGAQARDAVDAVLSAARAGFGELGDGDTESG
ncbi:PTS hybrid protein [Diaminobutyricimonas aerilata]|uniref:Phosphocarrier protein HPr n=1 Tax=Diaminobutyricimonas aerilata TaxID=1162967 RepID=A0A2M9CMK8_9MICO|nr:dihydroxyacetone kinase phosphoryl donor subunit DhaM [Diaminobutyricimonas aerilata]PJJ73128.1 PTS hybrid protein [Diaminobutyricimonas aerilata]